MINDKMKGHSLDQQQEVQGVACRYTNEASSEVAAHQADKGVWDRLHFRGGVLVFEVATWQRPTRSSELEETHYTEDED